MIYYLFNIYCYYFLFTINKFKTLQANGVHTNFQLIVHHGKLHVNNNLEKNKAEISSSSWEIYTIYNKENYK